MARLRRDRVSLLPSTAVIAAESAATAVLDTAVALSFITAAVTVTRRRGESIYSITMRGRATVTVCSRLTESLRRTDTLSRVATDTAELAAVCLVAHEALSKPTAAKAATHLISRNIRLWRRNTGTPCWQNRGANVSSPPGTVA